MASLLDELGIVVAVSIVMSRKILIKTNELSYHVLNRSNNQEWFYLPIEEVWALSAKILNNSIDQFGV